MGTIRDWQKKFVARSRLLGVVVRSIDAFGDRRQNMLRVLTYHRVAEMEARADLDPALISATPEQFARQVAWLSNDFELVSLEDVREAFRGTLKLPPRAVLLTFDDAYQDFAEGAWPILREYQLPVVLFVPTAYPGHPERAFWWDRLHCAAQATNPYESGLDASSRGEMRALKQQLKSLPDAELQMAVDEFCTRHGGARPAPAVLDWPELRRLAQEGVTLMPHTHTHRLLDGIRHEEVRDEVRFSRDVLRAETGVESYALAYPAGHYSPSVTQIIREEGFELGFTTVRGINAVHTADPLRLRRTNVGLHTSDAAIRAQLSLMARTLNRPMPASFPAGPSRHLSIGSSLASPPAISSLHADRSPIPSSR